MRWDYSTIGEHCAVTSSKRFHLSDRSETGIPFYCSKEIIQKVKGETVSECDYISEDAYNAIKDQYGVPEAGDLLITTRGTYGVPYVYNKTDKFYFADGNLTWLKDFDERLCAEYLYYWILSYDGQKQIDAISKGTAQKAVPIALIKNLRIPLPPIDTQRRIAKCLSTYDDIIENNRRQIKLLEEAAQRLYKEWFVDLRFPGYEATPIVDGLPEGWEKKAIGSAFHTVLGGTPSRDNAGYWGGNINWINSGEINNLRIIKASELITEKGLTESATKLMPKHTTVLAITGATLGQVSYTEIETCANQSVVGIIDDSSMYSIYLYCYVLDHISLIIGKAIGGAQQHINKDVVNKFPIVLPAEVTIKHFNAIVAPIFDKIAALLFQNLGLTEARDRLLPKLMSGEMEI